MAEFPLEIWSRILHFAKLAGDSGVIYHFMLTCRQGYATGGSSLYSKVKLKNEFCQKTMLKVNRSKPDAAVLHSGSEISNHLFVAAKNNWIHELVIKLHTITGQATIAKLLPFVDIVSPKLKQIHFTGIAPQIFITSLSVARRLEHLTLDLQPETQIPSKLLRGLKTLTLTPKSDWSHAERFLVPRLSGDTKLVVDLGYSVTLEKIAAHKLLAAKAWGLRLKGISKVLTVWNITPFRCVKYIYIKFPMRDQTNISRETALAILRLFPRAKTLHMVGPTSWFKYVVEAMPQLDELKFSINRWHGMGQKLDDLKRIIATRHCRFIVQNISLQGSAVDKLINATIHKIFN